MIFSISLGVGINVVIIWNNPDSTTAKKIHQNAKYLYFQIYSTFERLSESVFDLSSSKFS